MNLKLLQKSQLEHLNQLHHKPKLNYWVSNDIENNAHFFISNVYNFS